MNGEGNKIKDGILYLNEETRNSIVEAHKKNLVESVFSDLFGVSFTFTHEPEGTVILKINIPLIDGYANCHITFAGHPLIVYSIKV
jgi:hypothetical protein